MSGEVTGPWLLAVLAGLYAVASLWTFLLYGWDKLQAGRGGRRVAEGTLHAFAWAWGWPGALLGMRLFRHKTRKPDFQRRLWLCIAVHGVAWTAGLGWWWLR